MRIRMFYFIFLILLAYTCLSGGQATSASSNNNCNPSSPTPELIFSKIPEIKIETAFPTHMIINQSYLIRVSLVSQTGSFSIPKTLEQATIAVTEPTPVGTPGATVQQAFGPGFEPLATATLDAGTFTVLSTPSEDVQYLDQPVVGWEWNVTPKFTGTQILSIDINVAWKLSQVASNQVLPLPKYRIGNPQLSIDVTEPPAHPVTPEPFITLGQIKLSDLITVIIGAVLSAGGLG